MPCSKSCVAYLPTQCGHSASGWYPDTALRRHGKATKVYQPWAGRHYLKPIKETDWDQVERRVLNEVRDIVHGLGYSLGIAKRHRNSLSTISLLTGGSHGRTADRARYHRAKLVDLKDMCWRFGLRLEELIPYIIESRQSRLTEAEVEKIRKTAEHCLRSRHVDPREYPLPCPNFTVWQLASDGSWRAAKRLAENLARRVTPEEFEQWQQAQRFQRVALRLRGPSVPSPMEGGDLDEYLRATDKVRRSIDALVRRGILPFRVLPRW